MSVEFFYPILSVTMEINDLLTGQILLRGLLSLHRSLRVTQDTVEVSTLSDELRRALDMCRSDMDILETMIESLADTLFQLEHPKNAKIVS